MASQPTSNQYLGEKPTSRRSGKSPSRSPKPNGRKTQQPQIPKPSGYTSEGVQDHDIFSLPGSDWQLLGLLVVVAAVVRLFRIAQPSSVVFDEVQYVE
jgi:dolichyl-phosphate-mannose-protein mannosyltransferase